VFVNLVWNAIDAMDHVDVRTLTIRLHVSGGMATLSCADSGHGIPADRLLRIFDPFFTTKEVGRGTGQGLAIARTVIVEKHGGTLTFETEIGKGTTFFIRLPVNGLPAPAAAAA
jgi:signal transduction histidine kinase